MALKTNQKQRDKLLQDIEHYLHGQVRKHVSNVDNLLFNSESVETIEKELEILVGYEDKLNTLRKYFSLSFEENRNGRMVLNG
jgi:hypothetical protein